MRNTVKALLMLLCVLLLGGCSVENKEEQATGNIIESKAVEAEDEGQPKATKAPVVQESNDFVEEEPQIEDSGDGWYYADGMLYVSKIYYRVLDIAGTYCCIYEEPWIGYKNEGKIKDIIIDADMIYREEPEETKRLAGEFRYGQDEFYGGGPLFGTMNSLKTITINRLNLDKIRDISEMFAGNNNLVTMDASGLELSGVRDASYLFFGNQSLLSLNMEGWNTGSLETVEAMFRGCSSLTNISVGSWNTAKVKNFEHVFDGCASVTQFSLSGWTINNANVAGMFANCKNLCRVDLSDVTLNSGSRGTMFDDNNSISSYSFSEGWNIGWNGSEGNQPIGDDCHNSFAVLEPASMVCVVTIIYKKQMPAWYKEYVEALQNVEDFWVVSRSEMMDVFISRENVDASSVSGLDVLEAIIECGNSMGGLDDEEADLMSGFLEKLNVLMMFKDGFELEEKSFEELVETVFTMTEFTVGELEQMGEALSSGE